MPRRPPKSLRRATSDYRARGGDSKPKDAPAPLWGRQTQHTRDGDFLVTAVTGAAARKAYRCPGCQQEIGVGTPHLVVWPADDLSWLHSAMDSRRHWHSSCWHRRSTRGGPGLLS
ncbi:hypothetical protein ACVBEQ_17680 [Nakamurella sp. GG22]